MPIQQRFCAALALVYGFALWSFVGVWWMEDVVDGPRRSGLESARRREQLAAIHERAMKRGLLPNATPAVVFDEPLLNYMYAVKKKPPLAPTPRVFEQRDILLSDPPEPRVHLTNQDLAYHLTCDSGIADSNGPFVPVKSQQPYLMKVHAIPDIVSSAIKSRGMWEENIIRRMQTILNAHPKKSLVIDIGANIGFFTTFLASEGHRVIAVEPFGINIGCILATLCHRDNKGIKEHVHLLKAALLDQGAQKMCLWSTNTDVNNGNARLTPEFDGKRDWDQDKGVECMEKVQSFTLDYLLFQAAGGPKLSERVMIMKIDIEGSETKALLGSKGLLHSKFAPCYIFFEFQKLATETTGVKATDIFDLLTQAHYKISDVGKPELGVFTRKAWEGVGIGDFVAELMCSSSCECKSEVEQRDILLSDPPEPRSSTSELSEKTHKVAILILTCNRELSLHALLTTLSMAEKIQQKIVYVSIDCIPGPHLNLTMWMGRGLTIRLLYSHQRQITETGEAKLRRDERVTRHWLHAVSTVLQEHDYVLYLEDDHLVHPAIINDAELLVLAQPTMCPSCFAVQLGCHGNCWGMKSASTKAYDVALMEPGNMGVVYSKSKWKWFLQYLNEFCSLYGSWDVNLHHLLATHSTYLHALTFVKSRVVHNSACDSDRNTGGRAECDAAALQQQQELFVHQDMSMGSELLNKGEANVPNMKLSNVREIQADSSIQQRCMDSARVDPSKNQSHKHINAQTMEVHDDSQVVHYKLFDLKFDILNTTIGENVHRYYKNKAINVKNVSSHQNATK